MQNVFTEWQQLSEECKNRMDCRMLSNLREDKTYLYKTLIRSFRIWDNVQTVRGAPGWDASGSSLNNAVKTMTLEVANLLSAIEYICGSRMIDIQNEIDDRSQDSYLAREKNILDIYEDMTTEMPSSFDPSRREGVGEGCTLERKSSHCLEVLKMGKLDATEEELFSSFIEGNACNENSGVFVSERQKEQILTTHVLAEDNEKYIGNFEDKIDNPSDLDSFKPDPVLDDTVNSPTDPDSSFKLELRKKLINLSNSFDYDADLSLEECLHLKNIRIEGQSDSDVERQISPLVSDEELVQ